jgi:hypothetical protein
MSKSLKKEPLLITHSKYVECSMRKCRPDDETVANNYKYHLEHKECIAKAIKKKNTKDMNTAINKCKKDKWSIEYKKHSECVDKNCSNENKKFNKLINDLLDIELNIMQKINACADVKCAELIKERNNISDKCNNYKTYKTFKQRMDCKEKNNLKSVQDKIKKCKKKECAELHKELSTYKKKVNKILKKIDTENNKITKKNKRIYEKYYSGSSTKKDKASKTFKKSKQHKTKKLSKKT